jgi:hypothetical protein
MRADPYQARARALALEAGLDPDAKIDRPRQRPMPTWCTFRDAARKEQVAVETGAVAAALPPQAPAFQNAPLRNWSPIPTRGPCDRACAIADGGANLERAIYIRCASRGVGPAALKRRDARMSIRA